MMNNLTQWQRCPEAADFFEKQLQIFVEDNLLIAELASRFYERGVLLDNNTSTR